MDEGTAPPPESKLPSKNSAPTEPPPSEPTSQTIPALPVETPTPPTPNPTSSPPAAAIAPIPTPPPEPSVPTAKPTPKPEITPNQITSPTTVPETTPLTEPIPEPPTETPTEQAKKILLVDDDPVFTQLYASVFNSTGLNCILAEHGLEALDTAKEEKPDLILLDIMMPDINGFDVLKRLKANPTTAQIPVWMLTNLAEQIDQETAASLGAGGYLVKSTNTPKQVCQKIDAFLAGVIEKP